MYVWMAYFLLTLRVEFHSKYFTHIYTGTKCGTIAEARRTTSGTWIRNFAQDDKNDGKNRDQHGNSVNKFFSKVQNYSCHIAFDSENSRQSSHLRRIQRDVNQGANNYGKQVRTTTVGYKDEQKVKYFKIMSELVEKLEIAENLKESILEKAKVYFAAFRNLKEQVQRPNVVMAGCLIVSIRECKNEEKEKIKKNTKPVQWFSCDSTWDWTAPTKSEIDALSATVKSEYSKSKRRRTEITKWRRCGTEDELSLNKAYKEMSKSTTFTIEGVNYVIDMTKMTSDGATTYVIFFSFLTCLLICTLTYSLTHPLTHQQTNKTNAGSYVNLRSQR